MQVQLNFALRVTDWFLHGPCWPDLNIPHIENIVPGVKISNLVITLVTIGPPSVPCCAVNDVTDTLFPHIHVHVKDAFMSPSGHRRNNVILIQNLHHSTTY